ncbi:MAG: glycosyl hydrolase family 28-related protein, partial [Pseudomonadota bacterium]
MNILALLACNHSLKLELLMQRHNYLIYLNQHRMPTLALVSGFLLSIIPSVSASFFPSDAGVLDVRDFGAVANDGISDTEAFQAALNTFPNGGIVFVPEGVWDIDDRLEWPAGPTVTTGGNGLDGWQWKNVTLIGASREGTTLRLMPSAKGFSDPNNPKSVLWTGPLSEPNSATITTNQGAFDEVFGAQRFGNNIRDLTLDVGSTHGGVIGIQFRSNNTGSLRNVSVQGSGLTGIDLAVSSNGPLIVKDVLVEGFEVGIQTDGGINSQALENITVRNQTVAGLSDNGQSLAIRNFTSSNTAANVPAIRQRFPGHIGVVNASLNRAESTNPTAAIVSDEGAKNLFVNIQTTGYTRAIEDGSPSAPSDTESAFYANQGVITLFGNTPLVPVEITLPDQPQP